MFYKIISFIMMLFWALVIAAGTGSLVLVLGFFLFWVFTAVAFSSLNVDIPRE